MSLTPHVVLLAQWYEHALDSLNVKMRILRHTFTFSVMHRFQNPFDPRFAIIHSGELRVRVSKEASSCPCLFWSPHCTGIQDSEGKGGKRRAKKSLEEAKRKKGKYASSRDSDIMLNSQLYFSFPTSILSVVWLWCRFTCLTRLIFLWVSRDCGPWDCH